MTRLLASVTDADEAELAIQGGADLIDLKDPVRGALGALSLADIQRILAQVGGRRPVSATIGDLPPDPETTDAAIRATAATGVDFIKIGFFSERHLDACLPVVADLPATWRIVAVLFADRPTANTDPARFAAAGCAGVMLDTADKSRGRLLDHLDTDSLRRFVERAKQLGLMSGLAGSLRQEDIPHLLPLAPSYLGFRGALCAAGRRVERLVPERLTEIRAAL
ncbi:(5-formylfuran-3-yl)methyl phosphate synthase [Thiorhodococcus fuscus]|uniref:(5-formylfuran-3-yl)methyl phosphate synthase n=1 Tax=Thiorhodococcus fuscus TaxID=527200 RepID=A0ABW4YDY2_9GAMM